MTDQAEIDDITTSNDGADNEPEVTEDQDSVTHPTHEVESSDSDDTTGADSGGDTRDSSDEDEIVVSIEGETPTPEDNSAPSWVRDLRKSHRETQRENRELRAKLEGQATAGNPAEIAKKPTLEACEYDSDAYDRQLGQWYEQQHARSEQLSIAQKEQDNAAQAWQSTLAGYNSHKVELAAKDYDDAEAVVQETLSTQQQGMILQGADNSALVVYALGKNPKKAKELSLITDPVKFAFKVAKLETQMKLSTRKASTKPEKTVSGHAPSTGGSDSTLTRLRAEAEKTNDYSKIMAYKRQKRA